MRLIRSRPRAALAILAALLSIAFGAQAQRGVVGGQPPGDFDYYALVLSWSPTYCAEEGDARDDPQCDTRQRPYAFVLHGLWPQNERGYPENCRTRERPFVPDRVIDGMLDVMPSRGLVIHEYKKHGTCSGLSPQDYYALARRLYQSVRVPARFVSPPTAQTVSPEELVTAFLDVNPGLEQDMIAVSCRRDRSARLREIRICFDRAGAPRSCGHNESQRRLCAAGRLQVPPVRGRR